MKDPHLAEQHHSDSASFPLGHFGAQSTQQGLDVLPCDVAARRVSEKGFKRALTASFHG